MSELLSKHFATELAALGYPTEDVRYSLGYCQGDGVAFYGRVSGEGLDRLIARLMPPPLLQASTGASLSARLIGAYRERLMQQEHTERTAVLRNSVSLTLSKNRSLHLFDHYNTIDVEIAVDVPEGTDEEAERRLHALAGELHRLVEEDVRAAARRLANEGYALIEATPHEPLELRCFETEQLRVRVVALKDECFGAPDSGDPAADRAELRDLIEGRACYCAIQVEVIDKVEGRQVDVDTLWAVSLEGREPAWTTRGVRAIARDVLAELRGRMSRRLKRLACALNIEDEEEELFQ